MSNFAIDISEKISCLNIIFEENNVVLVLLIILQLQDFNKTQFVAGTRRPEDKQRHPVPAAITLC